MITKIKKVWTVINLIAGAALISLAILGYWKILNSNYFILNTIVDFSLGMLFLIESFRNGRKKRK